MAEYEEAERWMRIAEPPRGVISAKQERAIRAYARDEGFETLRGWASRMRMLDWDYYDVLKIVSP